MRTIKFKAKTSDGEWVEGSYIHPNEIMPDPSTCDEVNIGVPIIIDPNTLCQFTGLVDKNGVEGCRYDKVLSPIYGEGFIQWCNDTAGFYIDFGYDEYNAKMIHLKDCEIIGNIHNKIGER